jgi:hypothetical protein
MDFSKIKKEISLFLTSEEAKVLKKNIAKLGLSAAAIAAIMAQMDSAQADHGDSHSDGTSHTDGATHTDHADHGDGTSHDDSHDDHDDHSSHSETAHNSIPIYDPINKRGGHSSSMGAHTNA